MRPFFCRQGSKRKYSKALVSLFPAHQVYVEPFLGGGAVFWEKSPSPKEVINDLDAKLVADYRRLISAPASGYPILTTESAQNEFLRTSHSGKAAQIVESLLRRCNGFGGTYIEKGTSKGVYTDDRKGRVHKVTTHEDKLKNISNYRARLKDASLTNESYDDVLRKHDSPNTFFFMDPPYEKSVGLDYAEGSDKFPFAKFAEDVRKLKGKFLITINDSRAIRKLFKGLHIYAYVVKGHHAKSAIGKEDRKELLITNYDLPRQWKTRMTKGVLTGGKFHCEDEEEMEGSGTHKENVEKKLGLDHNGHSLAELAKVADVPKETLQEVYNRGIGAYKTNPTSVRMKVSFEKGVDAPMSQKLSKEQWAQARVYSFLDGNPKHDQDLRGGVKYTNYLDEARGELPKLYEQKAMKEAQLAAIRKLPWFLQGENIEILESELEGINWMIPKYEEALAVIAEKPSRAVADWGDANWSSKWKYWIHNPRKFFGKGKGRSFEYQLAKIGYAPATYIRDVRKKAKAAGYDPSMVGFANDGEHKLVVHTPDGRTVKFGRVGYGDHLIWTHLEERGEAPEGVATVKRRVFRKSHSAIRGRWRSDRFSPNNLALELLW